MIFILLQCVVAVCQEFLSNDNIVVGNVKRRNQVPLYQISRRFSDNLNYRKTKDIRKEGLDRRREDIRNKEEIVFDREIDDVIYGKKDSFNQQRDKILDIKRDATGETRDDNFGQKKDGIFTRNRDDNKREKSSDRQREEVWDRKKEIDENLDRSIMDRKINEIWDRRFEQSEREANRLEETNDKLDSLHQELRWLTINTNEGIGIGI